MTKLEKRLLKLEKLISHPTIPGTSISRVLDHEKGLMWCLSVGVISLPKQFFHGFTIEECLVSAEKHFFGDVPKKVKKIEKTKSII